MHAVGQISAHFRDTAPPLALVCCKASLLFPCSCPLACVLQRTPRVLTVACLPQTSSHTSSSLLACIQYLLALQQPFLSGTLRHKVIDSARCYHRCRSLSSLVCASFPSAVHSHHRAKQLAVQTHSTFVALHISRDSATHCCSPAGPRPDEADSSLRPPRPPANQTPSPRDINTCLDKPQHYI